jgi:hypothetical protein
MSLVAVVTVLAPIERAVSGLLVGRAVRSARVVWI